MTRSVNGRDLANSYRRALREGDTRFANSKVERAILRALVAESAEKTAHRIRTQEFDGDVAAKPLTDLVPDLQAQDYVGRSLDAITNFAIEEAKSLVINMAWKTTLAAAIAGIVAGFVGRALPGIMEAGNFTGQAFFAALVGLASLGGVVVYFLARVSHAVGDAAKSYQNSQAAQPQTSTASRLKVGAAAQQLFNEQVRPTLLQFWPQQVVDSSSKSVMMKIRGISGGLQWLGLFILFAGLALFAIGFAQGVFESATEEFGPQFPGTSLEITPFSTTPTWDTDQICATNPNSVFCR